MRTQPWRSVRVSAMATSPTYVTGATHPAMCAGTITQSEAQAAIRPVSSTGPAVHEASISPATTRARRPNTMVPPSTTASFVDARKKAVSARRMTT